MQEDFLNLKALALFFLHVTDLWQWWINEFIFFTSKCLCPIQAKYLMKGLNGMEKFNNYSENKTGITLKKKRWLLDL